MTLGFGLGLSFAAKAQASGSSAPVNVTPPSISFEGVTGYPGNISSSSGTWTDADSVSSIWQRNGVDISGTSGQTTYTMTPFDVGANITLKETATNGSGDTNQSSNTLVPDSQRAAWIDSASGGSGVVNSPGNPFQTPQSAYDALVASFGENGTFVLVFMTGSGGTLNVNMANLTALEMWVADVASGGNTVDALNCGVIGASQNGGQIFLWKATIPTVLYTGDAGADTINGGTIIGNFNSTISNLVLDGSPGAGGVQGGDGNTQTGPDGPNGDDGDSPSNGSDGSGIDASGGGGSTGSDGGAAVSITLNSIVVLAVLAGSGGNGGNGGAGGNGAVATGGRGGNGGSYTGGIDGNQHPGGNGGNGGNASANGGNGGAGGNGGNGATVSLANGATITAGTVSLGGGTGGVGAGGGQPGTANGGAGGGGGSGVDELGFPLSGNGGSMGSTETNVGGNGDSGQSGTAGSIVNV